MMNLHAEKIKNFLEDDVKPLVDIEVFESISSTNDYLKKYDNREGDFPIRVCLAEHQSGGRGRLNRTWYSPFGKNIYFSCRYPFQKAMSELDGLSLVSGLAIIKTLEAFGVKNDVLIKWPNDVLWKDKKLAGILIEVDSKMQNVCCAVIGIGINVNMTEADQKAITQFWTSLKKITGSDTDRNRLTASLINHLISNIRRFDEKGFQDFVDEWNRCSCFLNELITLKNAGKEFNGRVKGVNQKGQLLLELGDGTVQTFSSGDTTTKL